MAYAYLIAIHNLYYIVEETMTCVTIILQTL